MGEARNTREKGEIGKTGERRRTEAFPFDQIVLRHKTPGIKQPA
jgi:hypothetical protein